MVKDKRLIGREDECNELDRVMESDRSEFVIVYGRRRVGKTFLVDRYFDGVYDFTYVGEHNMSRQRQLTSFPTGLTHSMHLRIISNNLTRSARR